MERMTKIWTTIGFARSPEFQKALKMWWERKQCYPDSYFAKKIIFKLRGESFKEFEKKLGHYIVTFVLDYIFFFLD